MPANILKPQVRCTEIQKNAMDKMCMLSTLLNAEQAEFVSERLKEQASIMRRFTPEQIDKMTPDELAEAVKHV